MNRFINWLRSLAEQPGPTRVGVLNTGELILVNSAGHVQVLRPETTDLIRDVLTEADTVLSVTPIRYPPPS